MIDRSLNYGRNHVNRFIQISQFNSILDIGAGTGSDLISAKNINPACSLHAIEFDHKNIQKLKQLHVDAHSLDIEKNKFPFTNGAIDLIIMNQIFEHVKEVFWIFHEISRILTVGGRVILGVPNLASLHNRILLMTGKQPTSIKTNSAHVRGYTKNDIMQFLNSSFDGGYKLVDFKGSNFYPFPPFIANPLAKVFPTMAWGIFLLLEKTKEYNNEFLEFPVEHELESNFYLGEPEFIQNKRKVM